MLTATVGCVLIASSFVCPPEQSSNPTSGLVSLAGSTSTIVYATDRYKASSASRMSVVITDWPGGCTDSVSIYLVDATGQRVTEVEQWTGAGESHEFAPRDGTASIPGGQVYRLAAYASGSWVSCDSDDADVTQQWQGEVSVTAGTATR